MSKKLDREIERTIGDALTAHERGNKQRRRDDRRARQTCAKCGAAMLRTSRLYLLCPICPDAKLVEARV